MMRRYVSRQEVEKAAASKPNGSAAKVLQAADKHDGPVRFMRRPGRWGIEYMPKVWRDEDETSEVVNG